MGVEVCSTRDAGSPFDGLCQHNFDAFLQTLLFLGIHSLRGRISFGAAGSYKGGSISI